MRSIHLAFRHTDAIVANIGFAVGALDLIGGAALYFNAPSASAPTTAAANGPRLTPPLTLTPIKGMQSSSLLVTGTF